MSRKLYFYDFNGELVGKYDFFVRAVSETKLPKPSKKFEEKCCCKLPRVPKNFRIRRVVDIAFGDPIILRGCELLSRNKKKLPKKAKDTKLGSIPILVLEYKGKRVWLAADHTCLLEDLKKAVQ